MTPRPKESLRSTFIDRILADIALEQKDQMRQTRPNNKECLKTMDICWDTSVPELILNDYHQPNSVIIVLNYYSE